MVECQIFACVHLFELKIILSYCDITNRIEFGNVIFEMFDN